MSSQPRADLLPGLARLIRQAVTQGQIRVVSYAPRLTTALDEDSQWNSILLWKSLGQNEGAGQGLLDAPAWYWPER
ncbi:hypothetical protein [Dokdonella sp.]|uniref:hypothetical protein n=1 Tax=Dokdonella sp. TaxID=2291710 RepID=UPI003C578C8C